MERVLVGLVAPAPVGQLLGELWGTEASVAMRSLIEGFDQPDRRRPGVADHREVGGAVAGDRLGLDVDLHELGVGADERAVLGRPLVDRGAEHEQEIGLRKQLGRERAGEAARDADRVGEALEQAVRRCRGGQNRADPLAELLERVSRVGEDGAAARDDRGRGRGSDKVSDGGDCLGPRFRGEQLRRGRLLRGRGCGRLRLDVDRKHQNDRPALGEGSVVGPLRVVRGGARAVDAVGDCPHRLDQIVLVDPEVRGQRGRRRLAGQHEQWRAALGRLGEAGDRVRKPGPLVDAADPDPAADAGVSVGHAHRAALVAGGVKARATAAQSVRDDEVAAAEHAERVLDPERADRGADDVGDGGLGGGAHRLGESTFAARLFPGSPVAVYLVV